MGGVDVNLSYFWIILEEDPFSIHWTVNWSMRNQKWPAFLPTLVIDRSPREIHAERGHSRRSPIARQRDGLLGGETRRLVENNVVEGGAGRCLADLGSLRACQTWAAGLKWDFAREESKEGQLARILGQWKSFVQKWGITKCWSSQVNQEQDQVDPDQAQETIPGWQRPRLSSARPRPKVEQGDRNPKRMASTLPPQSSAGGLWKSYYLHRRCSSSRVSLFSHPSPRYII